MLFRKEKKDELEEIKNIMEEKPTELPEFPGLPHVPEPAFQSIQDVKREISAPLFVKVEKYREIISSVQEMKIFISGVRQLFNILNELESVRSDTIKIMRATLQRLEKGVLEIDTELLRPRGLVAEARGEEAAHIESSLEELQKNLGDLRRELEEIK